MSDTFDDVYMGTALLHAQRSKAIRAKVGAVLVTKTGIIIPGYNGTPSGTSNECEVRVFDRVASSTVLVTKPEVIHAELNCTIKAARELLDFGVPSLSEIRTEDDLQEGELSFLVRTLPP